MTVAKAKPKPISAHPLFPAVVALWFGALLGLGSLAVGTEALERGVLALQLDTKLSVLAPPLGVTSRLLLALVLAGLGGAIGFAVGRRFAQGGAAPAPKDETAEPEAAAPFFRRRALTASDDAPAVPYEAAPLPGLGLPQFLDITALDAAEPKAELELHDMLEPAAVEDIAAEPVAPVAESVAPPAEYADARAALAGDPAALGTVQLAERLALALSDRRERRAAARDALGEDASLPLALPVADPSEPELDFDDEDEFAEDHEGHDYGSLLALTAPIRGDEAAEPVVIFPGQLVRDPAPDMPHEPAGAPPRDFGRTEEALRAALANLQRLSGAA